MTRKNKKEKIVEEVEDVVEDIVEEVEEIIKENNTLCPKCGTPMTSNGGGPKGYSDFKCPACGAGLSKVI